MPETNGNLPRGLYKAPFEIEAPEKVSQTLLSHVDVCAYSGALYIRHKGGPQTPEMARGEVFHDFAEKATNYLIEQGESEMPPEVAKDFMQAVLEERVDLQVPESEQEACRLMAWNWGASTYLDLEAIVGVEVMFETQLAGWTIRGKIDRLEIANNCAIVRDYKTSLHVQSEESYRESFQPKTYGLIALEGVPEGEDVPLGKGLDGVHCHEDYPRYRREEDGELVNRYEFYDRARLHDFARTLEGHLRKLEHGIETGEWAAQEGPHCQRCPASSECPIPPELKKVKTIGTEGDAIEVARRIEIRDNEANADIAALKAWTDQHGILATPSHEWGFHLVTSERKQREDIEAIFAEHGVDPAPYLATNSKETKALLKAKLEEFGADPDNFFKTSDSTRFGKREREAA